MSSCWTSPPTTWTSWPSRSSRAEIGSSRAAALIVSHDRAFLERVTQRCFWLEHRQVRRLDAGFAGFEEWVEKIEAQQAEEGRRLDKMLEREQHWMERGVTARRARNEGRRRRLIALREAKSERNRENRGATDHGLESSGMSGKRVAEAKHLSKAFGERVILNDFSTRILRGDRVAIVGPNGAGKTTMVKLLLGELEPDAGLGEAGDQPDHHLHRPVPRGAVAGHDAARRADRRWAATRCWCAASPST